jgi:hypothetical protein
MQLKAQVKSSTGIDGQLEPEDKVCLWQIGIAAIAMADPPSRLLLQ